MKKQIYEDQVLTLYLLGSLSEEETERLDELSITDDEMAARLQVVENDLVDAYVRGELSGQTLERFNSYYLSSPKRREKIAFARGLQNLLGRAVASEQAEKARRTYREPSILDKPATRKGFIHRHFFVASPALQWGLAAGVLLMLVAGGWLAFENQRLRNQIDQAQAEREELQKREQELQTELEEQRTSDSEKEKELASLRERTAQLEQQPTGQQDAKSQPRPVSAGPNIIALVLAPQTRGVSQVPDIEIPAEADYVRMQLELERGDFTTYRAELKAQSGNTVVWRSRRLRARARGESKAVVVTLRAGLLRAQMYRWEVSGVSPTGATARATSEIIGSYPFRVVK